MLLAGVVVLLIALLLAADRAVKAVRRGRRLRQANTRLTAAAAQAEAEHRRRRAAAEASGALTSVMPAIHDHPTRHVD
jgi:cell division protein FtsL